MKRFILSAIVLLTVVSFMTSSCSKWEYRNKAISSAAAITDSNGSIIILSPRNGGLLHSSRQNRLTYNVHLSPDGTHLHVYIDNRPPIIERNVQGCPCSLDLPALSPGRHIIVVKEASISYGATGVASAVSFAVE